MNVTAELDDGEEAAGVADEAPDAPGAAAALLDELLHAAGAERHEGDLGGHEHAVEEDQEDDDHELDEGVAHQAPALGCGFGRGGRAVASGAVPRRGGAGLADAGRHADRELARRHVLGDDRAGAGPRAVAERDRRAEHRVDAEEDALADRRPVLGDAVVVGGDGARADVRARRRRRRRPGS